MSILELYQIKDRIIDEGMHNDPIYEYVCNLIKTEEISILENTSATGGIGGAGSIVSAQPSGLAGSTIGLNWASGGGTTGSGDVSIPYNPSGSNRVFHKMPMGKDHGPRTGKRSRNKKLDLKALKTAFAKRNEFEPSKKSKKVMDFNDFLKNDFTTIKK